MLVAHADEQAVIGAQDRGYLVGASLATSASHVGDGKSHFSLRPLWAFQLGPVRVSRSRANSLMSTGRERLETGVSTEFNPFSDWRFGVSLRMDNGRSFDDDPDLRGLPDVKTTVRWRVSTGRALTDRWDWGLSLDQDLLGRGGGVRMNSGLNYRYPVTPKTTWDLSFGAGWGNSTYMQTQYGISAPAAQSTGRAPYFLGSGLESLRAGLNFATELGTHWVAFGGVDVSRLVGPASRSPLVGRVTTHGLSVGLAYRSK